MARSPRGLAIGCGLRPNPLMPSTVALQLPVLTDRLLIEAASNGRFQVWLKESGQIIGDLRAERIQAHERYSGAVEIGYGIEATHRRQGYAAEAVSALMEELVLARATHLFIAGCDRSNTASIRVLRKLGFTLDIAAPARHAFWWVREAKRA